METFQCPVCGNSIDISSVLRCKDHSVSGEIFSIGICKECLYGFTFPQPDSKEIGKYYQTEEYISHSETNKGIINKLYHLVRKKNTRDKLTIVNRFSKLKGDLLDVGCGTGYFLSVCRQNGWRIEGIELSDLARFKAEERAGKSVFPSTDVLEASGKKFDMITLWHVFEHLYDVNASFAQLKRLLKPDGTLILALPNPVGADARHYKEYWAAYDVPRHLSHFSPKAVGLLAENHQMTIQTIIPMKFDAYYVSMLSEGLQGKGKISTFLNGFLHGFLSNCQAQKDGNYSSLIYVLKF
jgi:2-polyprenyl-3-methyl-5-hydroxy-6-metoxy-1,4-benzoquinol methylase